MASPAACPSCRHNGDGVRGGTMRASMGDRFGLGRARGRDRVGRGVALGAIAVVLLSGCRTDGALDAGAAAGKVAAGPVRLTVEPADARGDVRPDSRVVVRAEAGSLTDVAVADAKGRAVPGRVTNEG